MFGVQVGAGSCCLEPGLDAEPKQRSLFDADTVLTLSFLTSKVQQVSFAAVIGVIALDRKRRNSAKMIVKATVNVYGPKYLMDEVDQALSHIPSSLQHPVFLEPGVPYINPQFFYPSAEKTDLRYLVGPACEDTTSHVSRTVDKVMNCLDNWSEDGNAAGCSIKHFQPIFDRYLVDTTLKEYLYHPSFLHSWI